MSLVSLARLLLFTLGRENRAWYTHIGISVQPTTQFRPLQINLTIDNRGREVPSTIYDLTFLGPY